MSKNGTARDYAERALLLARQGNEPAALDILDLGIQSARGTQDSRGIALLTRNAGVISEHLGRTTQAIVYYEEALPFCPEDHCLLFAIGSLLQGQGNPRKASKYFQRSCKLASDNGDLEMLSVIRRALARLENRDEKDPEL